MARIDVLSDELIDLQTAASKTPGRPHLLTMHRWAKRGVKGQLLDSVLVNGKRMTTEQALREFLEAVSQANDPAGDSKSSQPAASKPARAQAARKRLKKAGI